MSRSNRHSWVLALAWILALVNRGIGDDKLTKAEAAKKYRDLVQQLASPNEKAVTKNGQRVSVKFPEGYDTKAQDRIKEVRQVLYDNVEEALPYLIEALEDERYCMTISWADHSAYYNSSVGDVCRNVIQSRFEVYRDSMRFAGPGHWREYSYDPFNKEWAQEHEGRSLVELQIEAIDWAIAQRKTDTLNPGSPKNDVAVLQKLRDSIAAANKPAKARSMYPMMTANRRE